MYNITIFERCVISLIACAAVFFVLYLLSILTPINMISVAIGSFGYQIIDYTISKYRRIQE